MYEYYYLPQLISQNPPPLLPIQQHPQTLTQTHTHTQMEIKEKYKKTHSHASSLLHTHNIEHVIYNIYMFP